MAKALLSPQHPSKNVQLAGTKLFAKQILPLGTINYKGRKLTFDKKYLTDLATAFDQKAFPALDFMMADKDNAHTMDPERWRGAFQAVEVRDDGLYGYLKPRNEETAQLLRENPNLPVSARIVEDPSAEHPRALQHVLGTLDPRVKGMKPWEEISLSVEVDEVIDLTAERYDMAKDEKEPDTKGAASESDDDEEEDEESPEQTNSGTGTGQVDEDEAAADERAARELGERVKDPEDTPEQTASGIHGGEAGEEVDMANKKDEGGATVIQLSQEQWDELQADKKRQDARTRALEIDLAKERYANEAADLIDQGVPPVQIELARAVLERPEAVTVVDLSNSDNEVNVNDVIRAMLEEMKGTIELSNEQGASFGSETTEDREQELLDEWERMS